MKLWRPSFRTVLTVVADSRTRQAGQQPQMSNSQKDASVARSILWIDTPSLWHNVVGCKRLVHQAAELTRESLLIAVKTHDIAKLTANPVASFRDVQGLLGHLYVAAANVAFAQDRPLMQVEVVFAGYCGYEPLALSGYDACFYAEDQAAPKTSLDCLGLANIGLHEDELVQSAELRRKWEQEDSDYVIKVRPEACDAYHHTVLGGTFDHLHSGHRILLSMATWLGTDSLTVGITAHDMLTKKSGFEVMESIETRTEHVAAFLQRFRIGSRDSGTDFWYNLTTIHDPYGPTKWDPKLQVIIGSKETLSGCYAVNEERTKALIPQVDIFLIQVISDSQEALSDLGGKMSSTALRKYILSKRQSNT